MKPMNQHIPDVNRKGIVILTNQQLGSSVPQCHDLTMTISQKKYRRRQLSSWITHSSRHTKISQFQLTSISISIYRATEGKHTASWMSWYLCVWWNWSGDSSLHPIAASLGIWFLKCWILSLRLWATRTDHDRSTRAPYTPLWMKNERTHILVSRVAHNDVL